jgi:LPS-assembly lipoprotein
MIRIPAFVSILALALLPLSACGFSPVYGSSQALANAGPIRILEIEANKATGAAGGRTGHFLRQELVRTVGQGVPGIAGSAQLEVTLRQGIDRLAFTPDQAASRSDYVGIATWTLRAPDGTLLHSGGVTERASFNFADTAYADLTAQTAAQERLATLLARSIRGQLIAKAGEPRDTAEATPPGPAVRPLTTSPSRPPGQ